MPCEIPDTDVTESVDTLRDQAEGYAEDVIDRHAPQTLSDTLEGLRRAQAAADAAERAGNIVDAIRHLRDVSSETDLEMNLRNLEMSGQLGRLTSLSGIETPGMTAFSNMMNGIHAAAECAQEGAGAGGGGGGGGGGAFRPGDLPDGPGTGSPFGAPDDPGGPGGPGGGQDYGKDPTSGPPFSDAPGLDFPKLDPLVLDLDGDGVALTGLHATGAYFDLDGDGFREKTGWISATDGFLVRDLNGNGAVDSIHEMFGTADRNAFEHLSDFDSNHDGVINASDAIFSDLKIWIDSDQDGQTDAGELHSLASLGVTEFSLAGVASGADSNGNTIDAISTFIRNGVAEQSAAVLFDMNQTMSRYQLPPNFQYDDEVVVLPELAGYGDVPDLRVAMTLDSGLRASVLALVTASGGLTYQELRDGIADLLVEWTGSDGVVAGSRGPNFDAAHLAVIEAFYGTDFLQPLVGGGTSGAPDVVRAHELEKIFDGLLDFYGSMFVSQAGYADAFHNADTLAGLLNPLWVFASEGYDGSLETAAPELQVVVRKIYDLSLGEGLDGMVSALEQVLPWLRVSEHYRFDGDDSAFETTLLSVMDQYFGDHAIKQAWLDILDGKTVVNQAEGDDVSDATAGDDLIDIAPGVAVVAGGNGADSYFYLATDGDATIADVGTNSGNDTLLVGLATLEMATFVRSGDDLIVQTRLGGEVTITGQFDFIGWNRIENFVFADGERLTEEDVRLLLIAQATTSGNDTITGFYSEDVLQGGLGNDLLIGGRGNDTYVYALGDGQDIVRDGGIASIDVLNLVDLDLGDVVLSRATDDANDLILTFSDGGSIRVDQQFEANGWDRIETFQFADQTLTHSQLNVALLDQAGTAGNDTIRGFATDDVIRGRGGDDLLIGAQGNDTYVYALGDGDDVIRDGGVASTDTLRLEDIDLADVGISRATDDANDLILTFSDGGTIRVDQQFDSLGWDRIESFQFADQTLNVAQLNALLLDQAGTAAGETIRGFAGNDVIRGRGGNDILIGGAGDDTYRYAVGDGNDVVQEGGIGGFDRFIFEGIDFSTATFSRVADDLLITLQDGSVVRFEEQFDSLAWYRIESFEFDGHAPLNHADILGLV